MKGHKCYQRAVWLSAAAFLLLLEGCYKSGGCATGSQANGCSMSDADREEVRAEQRLGQYSRHFSLPEQVCQVESNSKESLKWQVKHNCARGSVLVLKEADAAQALTYAGFYCDRSKSVALNAAGVVCTYADNESADILARRNSRDLMLQRAIRYLKYGEQTLPHAKLTGNVLVQSLEPGAGRILQDHCRVKLKIDDLLPDLSVEQSEEKLLTLSEIRKEYSAVYGCLRREHSAARVFEIKEGTGIIPLKIQEISVDAVLNCQEEEVALTAGAEND